MTVKIKICGLTRPEDILSAIEYGANYLGFIVEAKSARRLTVAQAARLSAPTKGAAKTVAVTVNPDDALLGKITALMKPNYIQLHGDETPKRVADIKAKYKTKIIKALPVSEKKDLAAIFAYNADLFLLDAKPPSGEARGGHGKSFDWSILEGMPLPEKWILAGGLTPQNVIRAARLTKAPILDVSSGVESAPGHKDASKIKAFIDNIHHAKN